ncbi:DET1 homolog isoform X2 [Daktulosphaira vitifoliae]|uniref:DET1 homolog isoform X2 n=1 Tax=Daktulosphaira vitifoliae TaxID=58002 RepID=UPI0021AA2F72|nr:DET1 homolog isoform X2 [Daktulosphaira vitifoliae]
MYKEYGSIKRQRLPHSNIIRSLINRETNVINVEKPPCYLRKFTPDGRHFIAFSHDQLSIEVYEYKGCSEAVTLLKNYKGNCIGQNKEGEAVRMKIFDRLFKLKHRIRVSPGGEQLNRECSLFTDDGSYVLVGSAAIIPDDIRPQFYEIYTNNEAVSPNPLFPLEDYTLHLVDIGLGRLCDSIHFKADKIFLSHNQGIYLYKDTLAVLSVQHQTINMYKIIDMQFYLLRSIGRFCYEDDHLLVTSVYTIMNRALYRPFKENCINGLKHKLMIFLFKKAQNDSTRTKSQYPLRKFYQYFNQFLSLRMWKIQLLNENHILIRYASEEVATIKIQEPNTQASFFMIYNVVSTKVINVFENTSDELLKIYENYCDYFRNSKVNSEGFIPCSPSNNIYSWESHQKFKSTIINAKFGGTTEANKRILGQLPIGAQSFTSSPYLDSSLFSYDEKWVSPMERPKVVGEYPIRFYSRESGLLNFCLFTSEAKGPTIIDRRRLVAFTFHPTDPFAISVQRDNYDYVVNFHIHKVFIPE